MNFDLPEELAALKEATARFAREEIAPHAQDWDREEGYPDTMIQKLGEQGYLGILVPEEFEGAGGSYLAFAIILEELARHDGGLALAVEAHNGLCCQHLCLAANEGQKKRFLPSLATGERIGSWCLSEPNSGTDAAAMRTRAKKDGNEWVLNGTKQFITNGNRAGTYVVTAVTDPEKGKHGISAFAVERGTPGLSTGKPEEKLGMRSSDTVCVFLEDVRVPKENLLGEEGTGFLTAMNVLERGRVMISALSVGLARGAMEESYRYAQER
ncbi:MAG: acyl-CoA dehydrogenase family protein, partial [Candidatus Omnitrophica bacterium]|nr:acyl-CoA dehydrogenase family protein [Candidatus Omnitrophota bacterium]